MPFQKIKAIADEVAAKKKKKGDGGTVSNEIDLTPQDNSQKSPLSESIKAGAVVTFGRMNPPTVGHEHLVQQLRARAAKRGFEPVLILSKTTGDSKNPLTPAEKLALTRKAFPGVQVLLAKDFIEALALLTGKYESAEIVVGADRIAKVQSFLKYNGKDFSFKHITVRSAGERDPDDEGVAGMSAAKMRGFAASGDLESFKHGLPANIRGSASAIMKMITEAVEHEAVVYDLDEASLSVSDRLRKRAQFRRLKSRIKISIKRAKMRRAGAPVIERRAKRAARMLMRRRFSGGKKWSELSLGQRVSIDKRLKNKGKVVTRLAKRLAPKLRRAEQSRKLGSNFVGLASLNKKPQQTKAAAPKPQQQQQRPADPASTYKRVNEAVNASLLMVALEYQPFIAEAVFEKLFDLASANQVPLEYAVEQFRLGYAAGGLRESEGFARLHSALHEGVAAYLTEGATTTHAAAAETTKALLQELMTHNARPTTGN